MVLHQLVVLCFWWMPFCFETTQAPEYAAPLWQPLNQILPEAGWVRTLLALVTLIGTAILLNRTLIRFEFYPETSYLRCLIFVLLQCRLFAFVSRNAVLSAVRAGHISVHSADNI